jgi:heparan-alpha-glucosaminide N-acetyltransferase
MDRMTNPPAASPRLGSIDAYRGLVMLLMMAEVLHFRRLAENFPGNPLWDFLARFQTHAPWTGCTLHDLIQPSFSFLVGVALPFSIASRSARGQSLLRQSAHALWRSLVLVVLGIALRSIGKPAINFTFEDTLTQIGLGYFFLFWLGRTSPNARWVVLAAIVLGYWALFAFWSPPGGLAEFDAPGVPVNWPYRFTGFAAHWNKNANFAWAFDTWFLNLFPRSEPFTHNSGGYATLSFIPTLGTMILGLMAGDWLRSSLSHGAKVGRLINAAMILFVIGFTADALGVCPSVKRIWTPSWVFFSGGWCFALLAVFYSIIDWGGVRIWALPLRVVGMNSIAAYCLAELVVRLGHDYFERHSGGYEPLILGGGVLVIEWMVLWVMDCRRIYVRI